MQTRCCVPRIPNKKQRRIYQLIKSGFQYVKQLEMYCKLHLYYANLHEVITHCYRLIKTHTQGV